MEFYIQGKYFLKYSFNFQDDNPRVHDDQT